LAPKEGRAKGKIITRPVLLKNLGRTWFGRGKETNYYKGQFIFRDLKIEERRAKKGY